MKTILALAVLLASASPAFAQEAAATVDAVQGFGAWWGTYGEGTLAIVTSLISIASVIANFTKTDSDNKIVAIVSNIIHMLAGNFTTGSVVKK